MSTEHETYDELAYYTLAHPDPTFIHQHIVDAYAAQTAKQDIRPITITFALVGLYLSVEKPIRAGKFNKLICTWCSIEVRGSR